MSTGKEKGSLELEEPDPMSLLQSNEEGLLLNPSIQIEEGEDVILNSEEEEVNQTEEDKVIENMEIEEGGKITEKEEKEEENIKLFRNSRWRWLTLLFSCFVLMGMEFGFGSVTVIKKQLKAHFDIDNTEYNLLMAVYSAPNIVLPMCAGFLIDKIGVRYGIIIFTGMIVVGELIFTIGVQINEFSLSLVGRCIFGIGGECINVTIAAIVALWFMNKELATSLAIAKAGSRLADVVDDYITPPIYNSTQNIVIPYWMAFSFCCFSFIMGLALIAIDLYAQRKDNLMQKTVTQKGKIVWRDILLLGKPYWIFTAGCFFIHFLFNPFFTALDGLLTKCFSATDDEVGYLFSIPDWFAIIWPPGLGLIIDTLGRRTLVFLLVPSLLLGSMLYFALIPETKMLGFAIVGLIFFSLGYSSFWTIVYPIAPILVPRRTLGTAFGILYCVDNLGSTIGPLITGAIRDGTTLKHGFFWVNIFLASVVSFGLMIAIFLFIYDWRNGKILYSVRKFERVKVH